VKSVSSSVVVEEVVIDDDEDFDDEAELTAAPVTDAAETGEGVPESELEESVVR
jgi:hypothetical protein